VDRQTALAIREAGFSTVRFDLMWDKVETKAGEYDFSRFDRTFESLREAGLTPMPILDYSNPLYEPEASAGGARRAQAPGDEAGVRAFAAFAAAAAKRYGAHHPIWEIWNEPEQEAFWPPEPDPEAYARLAMAAVTAIREADPEATVVAPGAAVKPSGDSGEATAALLRQNPSAIKRLLGKDPLPFYFMPRPPLLAAALSPPLGPSLDAVSVHPYLFDGNMRYVPRMWDRLREFARARSGRDLAVADSETGLALGLKANEDFQAAYLVRTFVSDLAAGVPLTVWYEWKDDDGDAKFGLVDAGGRPRTALAAARLFMREFAGFSFAGKLSTEGGVAYAFTKGEEAKIAAFADGGGGTGRLRLPATVRCLGAVDILGVPVPNRVDARSGEVSFGHDPVFFRLGGLSAKAVVAAAARDAADLDNR
jgi:hypothetical protein